MDSQAFAGISRRSFGKTVMGSAAAYALAAAGGPLYAAAEDTVTIAMFGADGKLTGKSVVPHIVKTKEQWKKELSPQAFEVTRNEGLEKAFTGAFVNSKEPGIYRCVACDTAVFSSTAKFEAGTGRASFSQPIAKENVYETESESIFIWASCRRCDARLGNMTYDGPKPSGLRYSVFSAALRFVKLA